MLKILLLILFLIGICTFLKTILKLKQTLNRQQNCKLQDLPYRKGKFLFSPAERSFLGTLDDLIGTEFRIFGKVRLADVIRIKKGMASNGWQSAFKG